MNTKNVIIALSIMAFIIAIVWTVQSNYEYEPIIVTITLFIAIIAVGGKANYLRIRGKKNTVQQDSRTGSSNRSIIKGDENNVSQF